VKGKRKMNKRFFAFPILILSLMVLPACGRPPVPPRNGQPTQEQTQLDQLQQNQQDPSVAVTLTVTAPISSAFTLTSPDLPADRRLPAEYTCDGAASTLALSWSGTPAGTQSYAVIMHHNAPETIHWYWVLYNIPANVTGLPKNVTGVGTLGNNINNERNEYSPPCSQGPGDKEYIYTVYALSAQPQITTTPVTRAVLLDAIKDITLASAELHVVYARP
jgi:Raf kinase inhibitor-like YbhB/YbcL family protein